MRQSGRLEARTNGWDEHKIALHEKLWDNLTNKEVTWKWKWAGARGGRVASKLTEAVRKGGDQAHWVGVFRKYTAKKDPERIIEMSCPEINSVMGGITVRAPIGAIAPVSVGTDVQPEIDYDGPEFYHMAPRYRAPT